MTLAPINQAGNDAEQHEPGLAEVAARRVAARTQWQKALARAKERFAPQSLTHEATEHAADAIGDAADRAAAFAWAHRGKIALVGLLGALFAARKPIGRAAGPLASRTRAQLGDAAAAVRDRVKR